MISRMSIGWSPGPDEAAEMREMFDRLGCREHFLDAKPTRTLPMPRECMDILYSISFFVNEGKKPLVPRKLFGESKQIRYCVTRAPPDLEILFFKKSFRRLQIYLYD